MPRAATSFILLAGLVASSSASLAQTTRLVSVGDGAGTGTEFAIVPVGTAPQPATTPTPPPPPAPAPPAVPPPPASAQPDTDSSELSHESARLEFGAAGSDWWSFGAGAAVGRNTHIDGNVYGAWSHFVVDDVEFAAELGAWYYNQEEDDAAGINPNIVFRWHFWHEQDFTLYADIGIGVLIATDNVPYDGTSFDFTPRAGVGATIALNDAGDERLIVGLRWAHVSNARIHGDDDNPGLDSIMLYSGFQFPF